MAIARVVDLIADAEEFVGTMNEINRLEDEGANAPDCLREADVSEMIDFVPGPTNWDTDPARCLVTFKPKDWIVEALDDMRQQLRWKQY